MNELVTVEPCTRHLAHRHRVIRQQIESLTEIIRNNGWELSVKTPMYSREHLLKLVKEGWEEVDDPDDSIDFWRGRVSRSVLCKHHDVIEVRVELEQLQIDFECLSATIKRYSPSKTKQTPKQKLIATMNRVNPSALPKTNKYWFTKTGKAEFEDALERYRLK